jgi:S-adenosylmethionine:diacylglycerol 3-amino-3-carboxypropyl transferase
MSNEYEIENILKAQTLIGELYSYDDEFYSNMFSKLYPFTTENIQGYLKGINLKNKSMLTVGSSADQILNSILYDCKEITCADINPFVKYYFAFKKAAILSLDYKEFLNFFCYKDYPRFCVDNQKAFSIKTYYKVSQHLDKKSRIFWDSLYLEFYGEEIRNKMFSHDEDRHFVLKQLNAYLNPESYNQLKNKIKSANVKFLTCDIKNLEEHTNEKFDYMFLSNISNYLESMYETEHIKNYKTLVNKLSKNLNSGGEIMIGYLYETDKDTVYKMHWAPIYNLEKVFNTFGENNVNLKSFTGVNGYLSENEKIKDSAVFYKKNKDDSLER